MEDRNIYYYSTLLEQFCLDVKQINPGPYNYTHALMFPHLLSEEHYSNAHNKFFYLGQDTRWWMEKDSELGNQAFTRLIEMGCTGRASEYLQRYNNCWPGTDISNIFAWGDLHTFWPAVIKLQIYLRTNKRLLNSIRDCTNDDYEILKEIGYGNIYSVERKTSLDKEGYDNIPELALIQEKSCKIDKLEHILNLYSPDFIIVFCKGLDEGYFFDNIKVESKETINKWTIFKFNDFKTKLICTYHPQWFDRYTRGFPGFDSMIQQTGDLILECLD